MITEKEIYSSIQILRQVALLQDEEDGSIEGNPLLTHHFIRLFIEAGFSPTFPLLIKSKKWFENLPDIEGISPFKIKSLIDLGEGESSYIQKKLKVMVNSQKKDGRFHLLLGYIPEGDLFSTLVAVDILISSGNLKKYGNAIKDALDWIVSQKKDFVSERDRGYAILLMAKYNFEKYENTIDYLLSNIDSRIEQLIKNLKNIEDIEQLIKNLKNIEDICWIIYDLMPLYNKKTVAKKIVDMCMEVLRANITFITENLGILDIYGQIMIGTRVIMALSAYYGKEFFAKKIHEYLTLRQFLIDRGYIRFSRSKRQMFFNELVGKWIALTMDVKPNELESGFSISQVYRLRPSIKIPGTSQELNFPSVIVKLSNRESFEREIDNYKMIPDILKPFFVKITEPRVNMEDYEGIIMEDLTNYNTLLEILKFDWPDDTKEKILRTVCDYLELIYHTTKKISDNQSYIIQQIYKGEILKSLSSIISAFKDIKNVKNFSHVTPVIDGLMKLISQDQLLNSNFLTLMHGDLNLRNIMIGREGNSISLKLIDIDKLTLYGDYAYDIGELIIDLDMQVGKVYSRYVEQKFEDFAKKENDKNFASRLTIGKINSLLKLAKINANRGEFEECIKLLNKINEEFSLSGDDY